MVSCNHCGEKWECVPALERAVNDLGIRVFCGACSYVIEQELKLGFASFQNEPADTDTA